MVRRIAADARARLLSDVLFGFLLMLGVAALAWWRTPRLWTTAVAGLAPGGHPVEDRRRADCRAAILFLLPPPPPGVPASPRPWSSWSPSLSCSPRRRVDHHQNGAFAITQASGRCVYTGTTSFVDCTHLTLPSSEQTLCPGEPLGDRLDPTCTAGTTRTVQNPTRHAALPRSRRCGTSRSAPSRRSRWTISGSSHGRRDCRSSRWHRGDRYEYSTAVEWDLDYVDYRATPLWTAPAFAAHGGALPVTRTRSARFATDGRWVHSPRRSCWVARPGGRRPGGTPTETRSVPPLGGALLVRP